MLKYILFLLHFVSSSFAKHYLIYRNDYCRPNNLMSSYYCSKYFCTIDYVNRTKPPLIILRNHTDATLS